MEIEMYQFITIKKYLFMFNFFKKNKKDSKGLAEKAANTRNVKKNS